MNERIKELATEHGYVKWNSETHQFEFIGDICEVLEFAELIIQDCVNIINHRADTSMDHLDSKKANAHARQVQRDCATTLEYAFGLKKMEMPE